MRDVNKKENKKEKRNESKLWNEELELWYLRLWNEG